MLEMIKKILMIMIIARHNPCFYFPTSLLRNNVTPCCYSMSTTPRTSTVMSRKLRAKNKMGWTFKTIDGFYVHTHMHT